MDPALLRVVVASREFHNIDDLMADVANGGTARLLAVSALAMRTNRRSRKDFTRLLFAHGIRKKLRWCFLKSIAMLVATSEKDGTPSCTVPGFTNAYFIEPDDPPIVGSHMTCACSNALTYYQCKRTSNLALAKHAEPQDGAPV